MRLIDEAGVELSVDGCWVEVGQDDEFGAAGPVGGSTTSDFRKAPTTDCSRRFLYHPAVTESTWCSSRGSHSRLSTIGMLFATHVP